MLAAVGDRGDVAALGVVVVAVCGHLFSWAVVVCRGRCGRSSWFAVCVVVVGRRVC